MKTTSQRTPSHSPHHRPIESPFPLTPLDSSNSASKHGLSIRHVKEIETIFRIFDPNLNGYIDVHSFEVMTRSLGFRMSTVEISREVDLAWEERQLDDEYQQTAEATRTIDLPMAVSVLAKRGYGKRSVSDEIGMYFRLFDRHNKGFISIEDLTRVQSEITTAQDDLRNEMNDLDVLKFRPMPHATLRMMIEEFDANEDGVIDMVEFSRVVEPILSSSSSSSSS